MAMSATRTVLNEHHELGRRLDPGAHVDDAAHVSFDRAERHSRRQERRMGSGRLASVVGVAALASFGAFEWRFAFGWDPVLWQAVMAAAIPALFMSAACSRRIARPVVGWVLSLVGLLWFLSVVVLHDTTASFLPSARAFNGIASGVVNGWARILSVPLPVPAAGSYLVLPAVLVALSSLAGVTIALRSEWPWLGAAPPTAAFALAIVFGIGGTGSRVVPAAAFAVVALLVAGATARIAVRDAPVGSPAVRRGAEVLLCAAVVVAAGALIGPNLPSVRSAHPYNPRTSRVPPTVTVRAQNPLDELSAWARDPHGPALLTVRWSGPPQPLQIAVLNQFQTFDGWTTSNRFAPAGASLASAAALERSPGARIVTANVRVDALSTPWVPAARRPVSVRGIRTLVQPATGILVAAASNVHAHYRVRSIVTTPSCTLDAAVPFSPGTAPSIPANIAAVALKDAAGAATPCARAEAVARSFSQDTFNPDAPSGSGLPAIDNFLFGTRASGGRTGTYEQMAATCALLVESLGMKARVVVGFHAGHPVGDGVYVIHPDDAFAWVEVDFQRSGWVPFFPTPHGAPTPKSDEVDQTVSPLRQNPNRIKPTKAAPVERVGVRHRQFTNSFGLPTVAIVIGSVGGGAVLAYGALVLLVSGVRRRRRQRRLANPDPRQRVLGAWREAMDDLAAARVPTLPWETLSEVVTNGQHRLGDAKAAPLIPLANVTNRARYSASPIDTSDALLAWSYSSELATAVRSSLSRLDRVRTSVDVRLLFRR